MRASPVENRRRSNTPNNADPVSGITLYPTLEQRHGRAKRYVVRNNSPARVLPRYVVTPPPHQLIRPCAVRRTPIE